MKIVASFASAILMFPAVAQVAPDHPTLPTLFDAAAAKQRIDATLDKNYGHLDTLYRDVHSHPEVGFQEGRTAALLAAEMRKLGFQVTEHIGKTGIVAIYKDPQAFGVITVGSFQAGTAGNIIPDSAERYLSKKIFEGGI